MSGKSDTTMAEAFVDMTTIYRLCDVPTASAVGVTAESIKGYLQHAKAEPLATDNGSFSKWLHFSDGSDAGQVRGTKRWEVWR